MGPEDQIDFYEEYIQHKADEAFPMGLLVAYRPGDDGQWYAGRVGGRPRKIEGGDWVVRLVDMQPSYANRKGVSGSSVLAASLSRLRHFNPIKPEPSTTKTRDPMELVQAVVDRWDYIERHGWECEFNGCGMIYASSLEDLNDLAIEIAESHREKANGKD